MGAAQARCLQCGSLGSQYLKSQELSWFLQHLIQFGKYQLLLLKPPFFVLLCNNESGLCRSHFCFTNWLDVKLCQQVVLQGDSKMGEGTLGTLLVCSLLLSQYNVQIGDHWVRTTLATAATSSHGSGKQPGACFLFTLMNSSIFLQQPISPQMSECSFCGGKTPSFKFPPPLPVYLSLMVVAIL